MKTLAELQTEIELGMIVYPTTNHDVDVRYVDSWYIFGRSLATLNELPVLHGERVLIGWNGRAYEPFAEVDPTSDYPGGLMYDDGYKTFETLLTDWPSIVSQSVWSTTKTPERLQYDQVKHEHSADAMTTFNFGYEVIDQEGQKYLVTHRIEAKTNNEARYYAETMVQQSYPAFKGFRFRELTEAEAKEHFKFVSSTSDAEGTHRCRICNEEVEIDSSIIPGPGYYCSKCSYNLDLLTVMARHMAGNNTPALDALTKAVALRCEFTESPFE